tara:strand:- start:2819 stop:3670 length:852 start_codon:yes stop_codon:yes gene_type:complete
MVKKYGIVYLMGGFGNQLFQLCFAESLRNKNLTVYIDTTNYLQENKRSNVVAENRELTIPIEEFGFKGVPFYLKKLFLINNYLRNYSFKNYNFLPVGRFNDNNINENYRKYNQFVGYWQDVEIILKNKDYLKSILLKNEVINKGLNSQSAKGSTALHIRRGDYLKMTEELKIDYYKQAIDLAKKKIENFTYDVFTDDKEWTLNEAVFKDADNIYYSSPSIENTIETFSNFFKYENYIISNSTFSLIPALLNVENGVTIAPDPWFKNKKKSMIYPENWLTIKNQ